MAMHQEVLSFFEQFIKEYWESFIGFQKASPIFQLVQISTIIQNFKAIGQLMAPL